MKKILITGAAGFIGSALADRLIERGDSVRAVDNFNAQYEPRIKRAHIASAMTHPGYTLYEADILDSTLFCEVLVREMPDAVVHIAGRTGMKASLSDPEGFYNANVNGTWSVLEACRKAGVSQFIHASSGSVYGDAVTPVEEGHPLPPPYNPYAATKRLGEKFAQAYAEVCGLKVTVLRVFTVYGPRQRSSMAIHKFVKLIDTGQPVPVYGDGSALRDYLYVDNCVDGIIKAIDNPFSFEVFNLGEQRAISLNELIELLSTYLGKQAKIEYIAEPQGIPRATFANIEKARKILGYEPAVSIEEGLRRFVLWYRGELNREEWNK